MCQIAWTTINNESLKKKKSECEGKMKKCRIKFATDIIDEDTFEIFGDKKMGGYRTETENNALAVMSRITSVCKKWQRGKIV